MGALKVMDLLFWEHFTVRVLDEKDAAIEDGAGGLVPSSSDWKSWGISA
jgi:hypothetical protein